MRYTYDENGNLLTRTDARGAVATMAYNARNQVISKTYSGTAAGSTPNVTYNYGGCTYGAGRLCSVSSDASSTSYTYDALGRVVTSVQTVPGYSPFAFAYSYNLADGLTEMTYPANGTQPARKVGYDYYASGRVKLVKDGAQARWVKENITYWPNGTAKSMTLGNDVIETTGLDSRLRVTERKATKGVSPNVVNLMTLTVGYQMNGNVSQETRTSGAAGQTMSATVSYGYDGVNRLGSANQSGTWSQSYGYDRRGNRWVSGTTGFVNIGLVPTAMAQFSAATNRLVQQQNGTALPGTPYDDAGNLISHPALGTMTYDGENRLVTAVSVAAPPKSATYVYDGEGRRVKRTVGTDTTVYVYDAMGQLAAEVGSSASSGTQYLTGDHLGSTRLTTDSAGAITKCYDYLPFGEELTIGRPSCFVPEGGYQVYPPVDKQSVKFTGKERDAETGLDYFGARYFSGGLGRFTSADEAFIDQHPEDPQSWNLYSYVRNNPLRHTDPSGNVCTLANGVGQAFQNCFVDPAIGVVQGITNKTVIASANTVNALVGPFAEIYGIQLEQIESLSSANSDTQNSQNLLLILRLFRLIVLLTRLVESARFLKGREQQRLLSTMLRVRRRRPISRMLKLPGSLQL